MNAFKKIGLLLWVWLFLLNGSVFAADKGNFSTQPNLNNGQKWRIGYYEGGPYTDYQLIFIATVKELMELGWIESVEIPPQPDEQTKALWEWLATNTKSDYIEFVADGHYSGNWDDNLTKTMVPEIIDRLNTKQDIDLMIAAGTAAGLSFANDQHHTPTIIISTADPLGSGIIKSVEDSGYDHINAQIDPGRYERQVQIFHDIIGFQKLGVAYEDSDNGRNIAALDKIQKVSQERGFEVIPCYTQDEVPDVKVSEESVRQCFQELTTKVDAIYVTAQNGINKNSLPDLVKIALDSRIPTFSQVSSEEVKAGFLLSISQAGFKYVGRFHAETIAKVFNGAKPRQLTQLFEEPPKIAINLKTAEMIGYDPPVDVLGAADEIYQEIGNLK